MQQVLSQGGREGKRVGELLPKVVRSYPVANNNDESNDAERALRSASQTTSSDSEVVHSLPMLFCAATTASERKSTSLKCNEGAQQLILRQRVLMHYLSH